MVKITCVSDLHGRLPVLPGGDLLIVAGDLTGRDRESEYVNFLRHVRFSDYRMIVVIAGNHDNLMEKEPEFFKSDHQVKYLCDSGTEFEYEEEIEEDHKFKGCIKYKQKRKLKIWGTPWTKTFEGMNPKCKAFTCDTEEELMDKFQLIPHDTDILITHSPPYSILDKTVQGISVGSIALFNWIKYVERPKVHIFGHIHEGYGQTEVFPSYNDIMMKSINCSHVDENYRPVNPPISFEL